MTHAGRRRPHPGPGHRLPLGSVLGQGGLGPPHRAHRLRRRGLPLRGRLRRPAAGGGDRAGQAGPRGRPGLGPVLGRRRASTCAGSAPTLGLYVRLLGLGFPLSVALGALLAAVVLGLDSWAALFVGAALAPTDAALGAAVMTNPAVPERTRRTLNVESGLNDGLATPVVLVAIAGVAADLGLDHVEGPGRVVVTLVVGVLVGLATGLLGGLLTRTARRRGWMSQGPGRTGGAGPGPDGLHPGARRRRQRLRGGLRGRPGLRGHGGFRRSRRGGLRRGDRQSRVPAGLAPVRRLGPADGAGRRGVVSRSATPRSA